ncbi:methyl-accepting chemotaxis protein [Cytobacillus sp. FJAT-54145]|uniref:Methyl-accepting chemotaxis protein n=1 Tax=Cytobacillus spartinae TaxID=3299023 RepID=A0ABW6KEW8_9BACI
MKSIKVKLISISLLLLALPSLIIGVVGYVNAKNSLDEMGQKTLKNGVEMAIQLIESMNEEVQAGKLSLDEAQEKVKVKLIGSRNTDGTRNIESPVDLGENGYFLVYDESGLEVAHPSLEGKNVWDVKDIDGNFIVQDQVEIGISGGGFYTYKWNLPNSEEISEKVTYNKYEPNWGWIVSAGTYKMDFNQSANKLMFVLIITLGASLLIGGIATFLFSKHLASPIKSITDQVSEVSNGNLAVSLNHIKRKDEIGTLNLHFNSMVNHLKDLIGNVEKSITEINSTSLNLTAIAEETSAAGDEVSRAIEEISRGAVQQASDSENTNQISMQFSSQIEKVYEKNQQMLLSSNEVKDSNEQGLKNVEILKSKSNETHELISGVQSVISGLVNKVKEIESIVGTINEISNQTNLLALNASIEAARAGEHGKGFAVVADEVRKLAEQTSEATKKVRETLNGIEQETSAVNSEIDKTSLTVQEQNKAVDDTESSFKIIALSINKILTSISETSNEMTQLIEAKDQLTRSIDSIASVSELTAASTEQVTSSIDEQQKAIQVVSESATKLSDEISGLKQSINKFTI